MTPTFKDHDQSMAVEGDENLKGCFLEQDTYNTRSVKNIFNSLGAKSVLAHFLLHFFSLDDRLF